MQEEVGSKIKEALKEAEKDRGDRGRMESEWWDRECEEKKKEVRGELRAWRRRDMEWEYRKEKKEYKELCDRKKKNY